MTLPNYNLVEHAILNLVTDVIVATATVSDTTDETIVWTGLLGPCDLRPDAVLRFHADGQVTNESAADDLLLTVYLGDTLLGTLDPVMLNITNEPWHVDLEITLRTIGVAGTFAIHGHMEVAGIGASVSLLGNVDTDAALSFTTRVQWDNAKAGNIFSIYQGWMKRRRQD